MAEGKEGGKALPLTALIATAVGVVVVQSTMITMLNGAGIGGLNFLIAIGVSALLALTYVLSFAELALMLPRAGSVSAYTQAALGPGLAIVATLSGYVAVALLGIPAELILVDNLLARVAPGLIAALPYPSLVLLLLFCLLNLRGIDLFAHIQSALVAIMFGGLFLIGIAGLAGGASDPVASPAPAAAIGFSAPLALSLVALAFWGLVGLEFVCPMIADARNPARNLPRAMLTGLILIVAVYGVFCLAGIAVLPAETLTAATPHIDLALAIFGPAAKIAFAVLAILGSATLLNTVLASVSRMIQGMAQSGQLPAWLGRENARRAPAPALIAFAVAIAAVRAPLGMDASSILTLTVAAAGCWLVAYMIVHLDHIILRLRLPQRARPFRSPLFPLPQVLGILGMGYVFLHIAPTPELARPIYRNVAIMLGVTLVYSLAWTLFVRRRNPFRPDLAGALNEHDSR
ncbi:MAG: APC family permease [Zoogloeaceae bacterium]|jgi:amino acid transporter|nr:APC family permease [Zoogloeaceae bacterium]